MFIELTVYSKEHKGKKAYKHTLNVNHIIDFHAVHYEGWNVQCVEMILNYPLTSSMNSNIMVYYVKETYDEVKAKILEVTLGKLGPLLYSK